jgi:hypothetical protein
VELDHVFVFTTPGGPEERMLDALGLRCTYRRAHPGQVTANARYAFENAFLELLGITDAAETARDGIRRTRLLERSRWRHDATSPFGIGWRPSEARSEAASELAAPSIATWAFRPPYLPGPTAIDVAEASDDPRQPMLFAFPGSRAPRDWAAERRGALQSGAGFSTLRTETLRLPADVSPAPDVVALCRMIGAEVQAAHDGRHAIDLLLDRADGAPPARLTLPVADA